MTTRFFIVVSKKFKILHAKKKKYYMQLIKETRVKYQETSASVKHMTVVITFLDPKSYVCLLIWV